MSKRKSSRAGSGPRADPPLTVSLSELLVAGSDTPFRQFVADLFAAVAGMQALRRALANSSGLSAGEFSVLLATWNLQSKGQVGPTKIARHLHAAPANITVDVAKLEKAGFIRKKQHSQDSRAVDLAITAKGKARLTELAPILRQINDRLFAGNTKESIAAVGKFLSQILLEVANAIHMARAHSRRKPRRSTGSTSSADAAPPQRSASARQARQPVG
jgi:DNA-binding MarR family transcriptional regulator